jgi:hypothetical protein
MVNHGALHFKPSHSAVTANQGSFKPDLFYALLAFSLQFFFHFSYTSKDCILCTSFLQLRKELIKTAISSCASTFSSTISYQQLSNPLSNTATCFGAAKEHPQTATSHCATTTSFALFFLFPRHFTPFSKSATGFSSCENEQPVQ